jgi:hypothetical protein
MNGLELLHDPLLNKGTAFTEDERVLEHAAYRQSVAEAPRPANPGAHVRSQMFEPRYESYI